MDGMWQASGRVALLWACTACIWVRSGGVAEVRCASDGACAAGWLCVSGLCRQACSHSSDCVSQGQVCAGGVCMDVSQAGCINDVACAGPCMACTTAGTCTATPADDIACGVIDCDGLDTTCRDYTDLISARCAAFGVCKTPNSADCTRYVDALSSTVCRAAVAGCDQPEYCDGQGSCPPDVTACTGVLD